MNTGFGRAARRELAVVLALAFCGIALVLLVAFAPWYEPMMARSTSPSVVATVPPDAPGGPAAGVAVLVVGNR
jgi:hypothetical protein